MTYQIKTTWRSLLCVFAAISNMASAEVVGVFYDSSIEQIKFAAADVKTALEGKGHTAEMLGLSSLNNAYANKKVVIAKATDTAATGVLVSQGGVVPSGLGAQAYGLQTINSPQKSFWVIGGDANGAMYGGLQMAENITFNNLAGTYQESISPDFIQRGVKLNLPLDSRIPTYSGYTANTSTQYAVQQVWDMSFWEDWLDQQARNRYNTLSVWVHHPFPALVRVPGYELACLPHIKGFFGYENTSLTHEQRVIFWRQVMTYAHNRGFSFYFFCWNVCTEYAKDMYPGVITESVTNTTTLDYLSKSMKALLETYPELDGFGISAGDNMDALPKDSRGPWTWKAYGKAAYDYAIANPSRKFTMIHRGLGAGLLKLYEDWGPLKSLPNMKFDYSVKYANAHMFSTLTPRWYDTDMTDARDNNQKTWLTLRNDDFLYMDVGDPQFVRGFLNGIPYREVINSFYIGSDIYHPARTYWCKDNTMNGQLEIQRNWYIQMLWGRTAYHKNISDDVFKKHIANRFPQVSAETLFNAWALASRPLPKVQELTQGSWGLDAHWYPEASTDGSSAFRYLNDFIATTVASTSSSNLCSIASTAAGTCGTKKSTYQLADEMEADAQSALSLINGISSQGDPLLEVKINNIKQLAYLSNHYAYKIRAATYKSANLIPNARVAMADAYRWWIRYVNSMELMYKEGNKFRTVRIAPDWHFADAFQLQDYTSLGGVGVPSLNETTYTLTTNANNGGVQPSGGSYPANDIVQLTASANTGFAFSSWSGDLSGSINPASLTMNSNKNVTANFVAVPTYTLSTNATNGSITPFPLGGNYTQGQVVTVTATANPGFTFSAWGGDLSGSTNPTSITMSANRSVSATFQAVPTSNTNILMVVGDSNALGTSDTAIRNRLTAKGYSVQVISDETADATTYAAGKILVLTSSTVSSGTLNTKFRDVVVPVVNWETGVQDDYGFTNSATLGNVATQSSLVITNPNHPLAAGLTAGSHQVSGATEYSWGLPGGNPITIASLIGSPLSHCIYAYDTGSAMASGTAKSRRVHLFIQNETFAQLNADKGLKLFDAAIDWAINGSLLKWASTPVKEGQSMKLEWTGGGILQKTTDLQAPWIDVPGATSPYLAPMDHPAEFYRVRKP